MALNYNEHEEIFNLQVDEISKSHLLETMRWTRFMGIIFSISMVLVCFVLAFVFLVYMPGMQTPMPYAGVFTIFMCLFIIGINYYPIFAMLKFSSLMKIAIGTSDQHTFNDALRYLKNLFKYIGILTIIIVSFYGLVFILSLLGR